jgi:LmbE family N-acetylglucosaminyl deacetylase
VLLQRMRRLKRVAPASLIAAGPILVLAPHPDDESLGCGGLIAACCARRRPPVVAVLTDGAGSHPRSRAFSPRRLRRLRAREVRRAVGRLGLPPLRLRLMGVPDTRAPVHGGRFRRAVRALCRILREFRIRLLCAPWLHDPHGDHLSAQRIARAAARRMRVRLLSYPVWGWTLKPGRMIDEKVPRGRRVRVARFLVAKRRAVAAHDSQLGRVIRDDPSGFTLPRAFLALFDRPDEVYLDAAPGMGGGR